MARAKRAKRRTDDPLAAYRRIRKPMPPPERVERDRRRDLDEDAVEREIEDGRARRDLEGDG